MKFADLKQKTEDELKAELLNLKKEQYNLRFQKSSGQLENSSQVNKVKKDIARVMTAMSDQKGTIVMPKRVLKGTVISSKSNKTIVVNVERRVRHPLYKKTITLSDKFHAHDENNNYKDGDKVSIIECKPISKRNRGLLLKKLKINRKFR